MRSQGPPFALSPERRTGLRRQSRCAFAQALAAGQKMLADKPYDCAAFRDWLAWRGTAASPFPITSAYRHRNKIERMFCRLKDARRIATRYDKCAEKTS